MGRDEKFIEALDSLAEYRTHGQGAHNIQSFKSKDAQRMCSLQAQLSRQSKEVEEQRRRLLTP